VIKLDSQYYGFVLDGSRRKKNLLSKLGELFPGKEPDFDEKGPYQDFRYDLLYFDRNHNGDMTDDPVIQADERFSSEECATFTPVSALIETDSGPFEYKFRFFIYLQPFGNNCSFEGSVYSQVYREGVISLDGESHHIVLFDNNGNGRFDDRPFVDNSESPWGEALACRFHPAGEDAVMIEWGDSLHIDPNLEDWRPLGRFNADQYYINGHVWLNNRFYEMKISPTGDEISLTPANIPYGFVSNPNVGYCVIVYGEQGVMKIHGDASGRAPLPTGEWKLYSSSIERNVAIQAVQDEDRSFLDDLFGSRTESKVHMHTTKITAEATRRYESVEVLPGRITPLPFGGPYRPVVRAMPRMEYEDWVPPSLGFMLLGTAGEICTSLTNEGGDVNNPHLTILNSEGAILEQVEILSVWNGLPTNDMMHYWHVPENPEETYYARVQIDGGLFEIDNSRASVIRTEDLLRLIPESVIAERRNDGALR
jgi:hypothetical protein